MATEYTYDVDGKITQVTTVAITLMPYSKALSAGAAVADNAFVLHSRRWFPTGMSRLGQGLSQKWLA